MTSLESGFTLGVDLGQANDFTALCVVREHRAMTLNTMRDAQLGADYALHSRPSHLVRWRTIKQREKRFDVVHLDRLPLGTTYPAVIDRVRRLLEDSTLAGRTELVVDATGVGRPIVDAMRDAGLDPVPLTITAGASATFAGGGYKRVPKADLIATVAVLLQTQRLRIAAEMRHAQTLVDELQNFHIRATRAGNDSYGAWRESAHDDLVLALAVALWQANTRTSYNPEDWATVKG